jgi:hypothetical protein
MRTDERLTDLLRRHKIPESMETALAGLTGVYTGRAPRDLYRVVVLPDSIFSLERFSDIGGLWHRLHAGSFSADNSALRPDHRKKHYPELFSISPNEGKVFLLAGSCGIFPDGLIFEKQPAPVAVRCNRIRIGGNYFGNSLTKGQLYILVRSEDDTAIVLNSMGRLRRYPAALFEDPERS